MVKAIAAAVILAVIGTACHFGMQTAETPSEYVWQLPEGFPTPRVPPDNPMTLEKVELGQRLFHDSRLSGDGTISCATCHQPQLAYTDGLGRAVGVINSVHPRSAMSLTNIAFNATLGWDDPALTRLEDQIRVPLFNTRPFEMGLTGRETEVLTRFKKDRRIRKMFRKAFPQEKEPVTMRNLIYALAAFERTLISGNSPYDRWAYGGEVDALTPDQRAGARLFFSRRLQCFRCHAGFNFSGPVKYAGSDEPEPLFHNTGLYNEDGQGAYPEPNTGVYRHSGIRTDMGRFRAPTLRNIALTAPYMHDGSIPTLEGVLEHYAAGGRARINKPDDRDRKADALIDPLMTGFELTPEDQRQLIAFLGSLTDVSFIQKAVEQAPR